MKFSQHVTEKLCKEKVSFFTLFIPDDDDDNNNKLHFNICKEILVKSDSNHRYDQVPKLVETGHEGKVTILLNQQCELTELLLTTNRTS